MTIDRIITVVGVLATVGLVVNLTLLAWIVTHCPRLVGC